MASKAIIVTGAPGSGKSTVINYMLKLNLKDLVLFDIDSIIVEASTLAGTDIHFEEDTWIPFRKIWISILKSVSKCGKVPVLFAVSDKKDFDSISDGIDLGWILLDCQDETRLKRIAERDYTKEQVKEVVEDANKMRKESNLIIDTTNLNIEEVSEKLLDLIKAEAY